MPRTAGSGTPTENMKRNMTPDQKLRAEEMLTQQMAMNPVTLEALRNAGLVEGNEVQLDFLFWAPNESKANALAAHLTTNDCLSVTVRRSGSFFPERFR